MVSTHAVFVTAATRHRKAAEQDLVETWALCNLGANSGNTSPANAQDEVARIFGPRATVRTRQRGVALVAKLKTKQGR
jgi:hypothetical protein